MLEKLLKGFETKLNPTTAVFFKRFMSGISATLLCGSECDIFTRHLAADGITVFPIPFYNLFGCESHE